MQTRRLLATTLAFAALLLLAAAARTPQNRAAAGHAAAGAAASETERAPRVAIVGAGIAGSQAASELSRRLPHAELHVFEAGNAVGGRCASRVVGGVRVQMGASIYHRANRLVADAVKRLNLTAVRPLNEQKMAVWTGSGYTFTERDYEWETAVRMLARFGLEPLKLARLSNTFLDSFLSVYDLLPTQRFSSPWQLINALDLQTSANRTMKSYTTDKFGREFVEPIIRMQYGQSIGLHGFAGMVSMVGTGADLFTVVEGHDELCRRLLKESRAVLHLNANVTHVIRDGDGAGFTLRVNGDQQQLPFDVVLLALPLELSSLQLVGLQDSPRRDRPYQRTHVTLVRGLLNNTMLGLPESRVTPYRTILTTEGADMPFSSLSLLKTYPHDAASLYKIFSRTALPDDLLDRLFWMRREVVRHEWQAYPVLRPRYEDDEWPAFQLANGLYYLGAMESMVSTMETQSIAAVIAANLAADFLSQ